MNDECRGIFGKIFGHSFKRYLLRKKIPPESHFKVESDCGEFILKYLDRLSDTYTIKCKRCGKLLNE